MKKRILISAMLMMPITSTFADNEKRYAFVDVLAEQSIIKDSKADLTFRNRAKYLHDNELGERMIHSAWAQAIGLNYQSGYFADFIGFDVSYIGVIKLGASKYFSTRSLLWNDGNGFDKDNARGFNKVSQRYVKIKLGRKDVVEYKAKVGWQILKNYGVLTASHEMTQNSYLGYSGTLAYDKFSLDSLYVTSSINRDSPEKVNFLSANKKTIDYIASVGINYKSKDLSVAYAFGEADDYIQRHLLELTYKPHSQFTLGSQIYANHPLSEYNKLPSARKAADGNSWHYAVDGKWQQDVLGIKLGIAYTKADKDDGSLGYFERHATKNARWRFNALTSAGYHYQRDGELALTLLTDYKYAQDFYTALQINYGQFNYKDHKFRNGEVNWINTWTPSDPRLKNFSIFTKVGKAWLYQNAKDNQPKFYANGHAKRADSVSLDIILDYRFNLL